jgi:UDP-3-O-[3-hydroxymyristoyl] glucosamine N-acyltransferase
VKRIPLCYGLGAQRHCTLLNRFNYGAGKGFGYFGGRLGHGFGGISNFGSLSLGNHLNIGKCSAISKGWY